MPENAEVLARVTELKTDVKDALDRIERAFNDFRHEIRSDYVQRGEYDVWTEGAWREIQALKVELHETKKELAAERAVGFERYRQNIKWTVTAFVVPVALFIGNNILR